MVSRPPRPIARMAPDVNTTIVILKRKKRKPLISIGFIEIFHLALVAKALSVVLCSEMVIKPKKLPNGWK